MEVNGQHVTSQAQGNFNTVGAAAGIASLLGIDLGSILGNRWNPNMNADALIAALSATKNGSNDAVITYKKSRETLQLMANLCDASKKYVDLAHLQYRSGSINYIDVLDAHRRYFSAQIALSNAVRDEHLALVQLYKVLGGGWQL